MFRWYQSAKICYAYLSDINDVSAFGQSRWFTRGWTLQELVATKEVLFYSANWTLFGSKIKMSDQLSKITGIDTQVLETGAFSHISIAERMSWAATRKTTRLEDMAYCLMGIFNVNMPLLYGEGKKSFIRLQEEIIKSSDDSSIFAWGLQENIRTEQEFFTSTSADRSKLRSPFADSPADFILGYKIKAVDNWTTQINSVVTKGGVQLTLPVWAHGPNLAAAISFTLKGKSDCDLCIPLIWWNQISVVRWGELVLVSNNSWTSSNSNDERLGKWEGRQRLLIVSPTSSPMQPPPFDISGIPAPSNLEFTLEEVYCLPCSRYSAADGDITLSGAKGGPQAVLFFTQTTAKPLISNSSDPYKPDSSRFGRLYTEAKAKYPYCLRDVCLDGWDGRYSRRTRFAIILGRDVIDFSESHWMKFIHILDENKADKDFHFLFEVKAELVQHCMTRSQLLSALTEQNVESSILWDRGKCSEYYGWVQRREEKFIVDWFSYSRSHKSTYDHESRFKNIQDISVHAKIQTKWKNLGERKTIFSINVAAGKEERWLRIP